MDTLPSTLASSARRISSSRSFFSRFTCLLLSLLSSSAPLSAGGFPIERGDIPFNRVKFNETQNYNITDFLLFRIWIYLLGPLLKFL